MDYRVVPITGKHIAGFRAALDVVAKERRYLLFLEAPPLAETKTYIRRQMRRGCPHYIALVAGRVVGWCDVLRGDRVTTAHGGTLGIAVVPEFRGRGIGTALLQAALKRAKSSGLKRVELTVRADNRRAIAVYEKLGFFREGVKRNAMRVDGKYWNLVCMAQLFNP